MIVMIDERFDLRFQICREEVVLQQDAVLQRLMPSFDLALSLWMIRRAPDVAHFPIIQPFSQFAGDLAGAVVR